MAPPHPRRSAPTVDPPSSVEWGRLGGDAGPAVVGSRSDLRLL